MTKAELESKHLSDLHALAAEAGVERFRMLSRGELIERLSDGQGGSARSGAARSGSGGSSRERGERPARRRRRRSGSGDALGDEAIGAPPSRSEKREQDTDEISGHGDELGEQALRGARRKPRAASKPAADASSAAEPAAEAPEPASEPSRPKRRRRRRRFGRRKEGVALQDLLLPPEAGRQAVLCAETQEACTTLLRGVAADLAGDSKGPDPVILLIDPSPEELADWKREAPQAEIVAAGQARHADDALAQAAARADRGEDVILLVDSLTRLAGGFGDTDTAKEFFDAGRAQGTSGGGSLTVVAALERA
jgi:transcription termination factor Rho